MCRGKAYYRNRGHHPRHQHGHRARHWKAVWAWNTPPVNVKEQDDQYELLVYAAGYEKTDFQVQVNDHILVVKVEKKESDIVDSPNWRRQEFYANGFERRFELNEKINKDGIRAAYKEGVLHIVLPKLEGFENKRQDIVVA